MRGCNIGSPSPAKCRLSTPNVAISLKRTLSISASSIAFLYSVKSKAQKEHLELQCAAGEISTKIGYEFFASSQDSVALRDCATRRGWKNNLWESMFLLFVIVALFLAMFTNFSAFNPSWSFVYWRVASITLKPC